MLKVTAYIVSAENWPLFNQVFAEAFGDHKPSRSVVPVPELHHGYLIEIDGVALDPRPGDARLRGKPLVTITAAGKVMRGSGHRGDAACR